MEVLETLSSRPLEDGLEVNQNRLNVSIIDVCYHSSLLELN
jgi:hypothetical protein